MLYRDQSGPRSGVQSCIFCVIASIFFLSSGCGFTSIHGPGSPATISNLAKFKINPIPDRIGQMLRNELIQQMRHGADVETPRFYVAVSLVERLNELGIQKDDVATRANLILDATFRVTEDQNGQSIYIGRSRSVSSYDILTSDFATLSALRDARRRGVKTLAQNIKSRISVWLIQRQNVNDKK